MGLYACLNIEDGYPLELSQDVLGEEVFVDVDYSAACEAFCTTFMQVATELVPVLTGYLRSTLSVDSDYMTFCEAIATCEYAEYVEFGTTYQAAQPYFEPALEAACAAFAEEATWALNWAQEQLYSMASAIMDAAMAAAGAAGTEFTFGQMMGGLMLGGLMLLLFFPIAIALTGILDPLNILITGHSIGEGPGSSGASIMPEIEII